MIAPKWIVSLLLFVAVGIPGCASPARELRVLTYNIHHGRGTDDRFDYDRLAAVIAKTKPDLVALQEVDRGTGRVSGVDQAALLGEKLGMHAAFGQAMPYDGGQYGEAVLSRFPFERMIPHALGCEPGQEPRAALEVTVRPWGEDGPLVQFTGTHLCHQSAKTRRRQVGEIRRAIESWSGPAILTGDFNFTPDTASYQDLVAEWDDAARAVGDEQPTFGADRPPSERDKRIDFVWLRRGTGLTIRSIEVIEEPLASDHLPVLAVLRWERE